MGRLREVETESERLREEIDGSENSAAETESAIDSLLVTMRSGNRVLNIGKTMRIEDDYDRIPDVLPRVPAKRTTPTASTSAQRPSGSVAYFNQNRIPSRTNNIEAISHRFSSVTAP